MERNASGPQQPKRIQRIKPEEKSTPGRDLAFMEATFRVVGYERRENEGKTENSIFQPNRRSSLSPGKHDLVEFIEINYLVPENFETDTKFGPHSGLCYEDRLITCYEWRQLKPRPSFAKDHEHDNAWKICWKCSQKGDHLAREGCPNEEA